MHPHRTSAAFAHRRSVRQAVRALAVCVAFGLALVVLSPVSAVATSVSLKPVADTFVSSAGPTLNFGTGPALRTDGSPVVHSYLRFDLSGTSGTIWRAVLKLHANSTDVNGLSAHAVANTTWSETGTTYANAPAMGSAAVSSGAVAASATIGLDVTSFVSGHHGLLSLGLTDNDATAISLASRESSYPPSLVLTVALASPTPAAPKTASASSVRAAFYYPWFPEAWDQSGLNPFTHYHPSLGYYDGADPSVVRQHIAAMQYGKIQVGIASWWGQGSQSDAKVPTLLSVAAGTGFRWAFYYEMEGTTNPSASRIASDLAYINSHYGADPSTSKIGGRVVVFVYGGPDDNCSTATRWKQGNAAADDYIVLKVFPGYTGCADQPDQWHQYSPAVAEDRQAGRTFSISPGFWLATSSSPRLGRDLARWKQNVRDMVASHEPWQLVTTFNEWGEGTAVESATSWASASGYGAYLDALHSDGY